MFRPGEGGNGTVVEQYPIARSVLVLLSALEEYLEIASHLQAVGPELINKLVELLSLFNSRTCQLLLGAGATHLAMKGQKITSGHLALASQCIGLLMTQIPVARQVLAERLPKQHAVLLSSLDTVLKDYSNHQQELYAKLVDIVRSMLNSCLQRSGITTGEWPKEGAPVDAVDPAIDELMRQVTALHKVLTELVPPQQRDSIFARISDVFNVVMGRALSRLDLTRRSVSVACSVNAAFVVQRLRALTNDPLAGKELEAKILHR